MSTSTDFNESIFRPLHHRGAKEQQFPVHPLRHDTFIKNKAMNQRETAGWCPSVPPPPSTSASLFNTTHFNESILGPILKKNAHGKNKTRQDLAPGRGSFASSKNATTSSLNATRFDESIIGPILKHTDMKNKKVSPHDKQSSLNATHFNESIIGPILKHTHAKKEEMSCDPVSHDLPTKHSSFLNATHFNESIIGPILERKCGRKGKEEECSLSEQHGRGSKGSGRKASMFEIMMESFEDQHSKKEIAEGKFTFALGGMQKYQ